MSTSVFSAAGADIAEFSAVYSSLSGEFGANFTP